MERKGVWSLGVQWLLTCAVAALAAALVSTAMARSPRLAEGWGGWPWVVGVAVGAGVGLAGHRRTLRRLRRMLRISQAWVRGNFAPRIADGGRDELARLGGNLDLLADHLEADEQDLEALRARNARLTDQVRALAVVEERNRLARELHDSVKQHLFSLAMTTGAVRAHLENLPNIPDDLMAMVREVEEAAKTAQRETSRLIEDLRPDALQTQGLAAALNDYTLVFGAREHLLVYLDVKGDDSVLPPSVAETLYRVAQEALHNVARHAQATRVDVRLRCTHAYVTLEIEDNGIGFDPRQTRYGLGLPGMQERMMAVGGRLTITSRPGEGTRILAEVALPGERPFADELKPPSRLRIEDWSWLGQKLVIPVGQTWPWLPADLVHLRRPLIEVEESPLRLVPERGLWQRIYRLHSSRRDLPWLRIRCGRGGYTWQMEGATWRLRAIYGMPGCLVLTRNHQPLAAMQYRGPHLHMWTEIAYGEQGYRLTRLRDERCAYLLTDEMDERLLCFSASEVGQATLYHPLPAPLVVMAMLRVMEESSVDHQ